MNWRQYASLTDDELRAALAANPGLLEELKTTARQDSEAPVDEGVGLWDRAKMSFAGTEEGKRNILRSSGHEPVTMPGGDMGIRTPGGDKPVDPSGLDIGDIADFAGDVPATVLGTLGGMAGAGLGLLGTAGVSSVPLSMAGAGAGSAVGEAVRQGVGNLAGSQEGLRPMDIAKEGAWGVVGEGAGNILGKLAIGPFRKAAGAPRAHRRMAAVRQLDSDVGNAVGQGIADVSPVSAQADSRFLGNIEATARQSPYGGNPLRDVDEQLYGRLEKAFDSIAAKVAPATRARSRGVGQDVQQAAGAVFEARKTAAEGLWEQLATKLPPDQPVAMNETYQAVRELYKGDIVRQFTKDNKATGTEGARQLIQALKESSALSSFGDLESEIRRVASTIPWPWRPMLPPVKMSEPVENAMRRLHAALMADREAFLDVLEKQGAPDVAALSRQARQTWSAFKELQGSPIVRKVFGNPLRFSEMADQLAHMTPDEAYNLKQILGAVDVGDAFPATPEGQAAWQKLARATLDKLKAAARNPKESDVAGSTYVLSPDRLASALTRFKDGLLEEVVGPDVTSQLVNLADASMYVTVPQRMLTAWSNTPVQAGSPMYDVAQMASQKPMSKAAEIAAKFAIVGGAGRALKSAGGREYLLGAKPWQTKNRTLLEALARLGVQAPVHTGITPALRRD